MWVAFFLACGGQSALDLPFQQIEPYSATLLANPVRGVATTDASVVVDVEDQWRWIHPDGEVERLFPWTGTIRGAAQVGTDRFVLVDRVTVVRGNTAVDALLSDVLPGEPESLCSDGDAVWIQTDQGVVLWRAGVLAELRVDGRPMPGPAACGGSLYGERVAWLAEGELLHAFAGNGAAWAVFETTAFADPVDSVAVDGTGWAWVTSAGALHARTSDGWREVVLEVEALEVFGGRGSAGVWVTTTDGLRWVDAERIIVPTGPSLEGAESGGLQTDAVGRLTVSDTAGVHQVAIDRPLWLDGPLEGAVVAEPVLVSLSATAPEEVTGLRLQLRGGADPLDLPLSEGAAVFDPQGLPPGPYVLRAEATYADRTTVVERNVEVLPAGSITWTAHVQSIHEGSCAVCHTGSTETVLDGPEAWEASIAGILDNVESGAMPLGGPSLAPGDIALIRAWRDGGFTR
ncbi:MAG: hypothetical protein KTR31_12710 [Myxococcales bacterium]|nr:hypothetical protein [Myxococcales bacterium]